MVRTSRVSLGRIPAIVLRNPRRLAQRHFARAGVEELDDFAARDRARKRDDAAALQVDCTGAGDGRSGNQRTAAGDDDRSRVRERHPRCNVEIVAVRNADRALVGKAAAAQEEHRAGGQPGIDRAGVDDRVAAVGVEPGTPGLRHRQVRAEGQCRPRAGRLEEPRAAGPADGDCRVVEGLRPGKGQIAVAAGQQHASEPSPTRPRQRDAGPVDGQPRGGRRQIERALIGHPRQGPALGQQLRPDDGPASASSRSAPPSPDPPSRSSARCRYWPGSRRWTPCRPCCSPHRCSPG